MSTKCAPNAHQMQFGVPHAPLPLSSSIFNFDFHFPTCGFIIFVSTSSFISNPSLFIFKPNLDSRDAPQGAPLFFTPNQRPWVKAIYGLAAHSWHLSHTYMPDSHAPAIQKMHGKPTIRLLASYSKNVWQRASVRLGTCTVPLGQPYAMRMPRGRATTRRGLGNPQVTLKQPSGNPQASFGQVSSSSQADASAPWKVP